MPLGGDRAAEDIARCREILRAGSKSFYVASLFLPGRVRGPASVIYAFCRVADDAVDLVSPEKAPAALDRMRARLHRVYADRPDDHPVDRALAAVVQRARLPREVPEALLEGFQWDVEGRRYETLDELLGYCARVASTVGVMMTVLMGRRDHRVLARACDLGAAMQLTNICRDVGEDARNGRVYLPLQWLRDAGIDPDALTAHPSHSEALGGWSTARCARPMGSTAAPTSAWRCSRETAAWPFARRGCSTARSARWCAGGATTGSQRGRWSQVRASSGC